jgi:hypothetical protein
MIELQREKVLSALAAKDFIGRTRELDTVLRHAKGEGKTGGLLISGAPALGVSELLRQAFDRLFDEPSGAVVPVYFALRRSDKTARGAAMRFLQNFLQQVVAFRRQDEKILDAGCDVCELSEIAPPADGYWIDRLIETCRAGGKLNDDAAFVRHCLSAPLRALANGVRIFVMFDDLHQADHFAGEIDLVEELNEIFSRAGAPFVFAGRRRFLFVNAAGAYEKLEIKPLSFAEAGSLAKNLADRAGVKINEQTRDLLAVQFDGNPLFIKFLIQSASEKRASLDSFQKVQQIYANEIFGGKIGRFYDAAFREISPKTETQKSLLSLLFDAQNAEHEKTHLEIWQSRTGLTDAEFRRAMRLLNAGEIIRLSSNLIEPMAENRPLGDYVAARFRLEIVLQNRALTVGETLSDFVKRAPRLMTEFYRRHASIGLREILGVFDCQEIPASLLDYARFRDELKGAPHGEILKALKGEAEKITLPQVVYTAHTGTLGGRARF